ncbi:MAG: BamA/TamA family outer membrane protein, partial [Holophagales bacterium]|nr:BamA/TamA family outer membrane protein [Holophagales bacterium]
MPEHPSAEFSPVPPYRGSPRRRASWGVCSALFGTHLLALAVGWLGLVAVPAHGEGVLEAPAFYIETIRVDGLRRASADLIVAESLLLEGFEYTEADLLQAVFRIQRLPFVLDASFSLEKGSRRGRFTLVMAVEEIRRYFFGEDLIFTRFTNSVAFESFPGNDWTISPGGLAGIRFFVGRYGVLFGSVALGRGVQAGYTQYNLFDRRIFANLSLTAGGCCPVDVFSLGIDPTFSSWQNEGDSRSVQLTLGVPLYDDLGLRLRASESWGEEGERRYLLESRLPRLTFHYRDQRRTELEFSLTYDTTDDPVFPSRGLAAALTLDFQRLSADLGVAPRDTPFVLAPEPVVGLPPMESRQLRLAASVAQHWSMGSRHSFSLSARVAVGRGNVDSVPTEAPAGAVGTLGSDSCAGGVLGGATDPDCVLDSVRLLDEDVDLLEGYFTARHSVSLWGLEKTRSRGDLRLETTFEFGYDETWPDLDLP